MTEQQIAAMRQALEVLEENHHLIEEHERPEYLAHYDRVISGLSKALEQPAQCKYGNEPASCTSSPMDCQCALDAVFEQPAIPKGWKPTPDELRKMWFASKDGWDFYCEVDRKARNASEPEPPAQKRPQNCGTGYCSCIECVMEPEQPAQQTHCDDCGGFDPECPLAKPAQHEIEELTAQRDKLADILTRTANALKGQPAELSEHSWHDLPEVAQRLKVAQQEQKQ